MITAGLRTFLVLVYPGSVGIYRIRVRAVPTEDCNPIGHESRNILRRGSNFTRDIQLKDL